MWPERSVVENLENDDLCANKSLQFYSGYIIVTFYCNVNEEVPAKLVMF